MCDNIHWVKKKPEKDAKHGRSVGKEGSIES
jgi:hypothetical protein